MLCKYIYISFPLLTSSITPYPSHLPEVAGKIDSPMSFGEGSFLQVQCSEVGRKIRVCRNEERDFLMQVCDSSVSGFKFVTSKFSLKDNIMHTTEENLTQHSFCPA